MLQNSSQMDSTILFAEFLELLRFEGSSAVSYNCMGKTEILLQEFDRGHRWYWLRCVDAVVLRVGIGNHKPVTPQKVDGVINM